MNVCQFSLVNLFSECTKPQTATVPLSLVRLSASLKYIGWGWTFDTKENETGQNPHRIDVEFKPKISQNGPNCSPNGAIFLSPKYLNPEF